MSNDVTFESLNLHPLILRAIEEAGYTNATPIQAQAIPVVMDGHDLMASAQTGTGKTAAFALPALNLLATPHESKSRGPRILVLVPTRELAAQVNEAARKYGKFIRARTVSIVGGMPYPLQNKLLSQPLDILVATPGRLIDHMDRGRIDMSRLQMLILDEADRMLDMGFMPDVERICEALPAERQTLLFSATLDGNIGRIAHQILRNPKTIQVASQTQKHENIEQRLHYVDDMTHKNKLLEHLLIAPEVNQVIVFTSTKRHADLLAEDLYAAGHKTAALHGDMTQGARNRTLTKLRHGDVKVLVATDVAARGIDIAGITHVINYDLPKFAEDYVHRIGRTGRAGNTGIAISFASNMDRHQVRKIEQFTGQRLEPSVIAGFEPKRAAPRTDGPSRSGRPGERSGRPSNGRPGDRNGRPSNNSFGDRGNDRSARPSGDRERSFGDRAAFGDRPAGDRNSRPSNNSFGDRAARPSGDRERSFGDRAASGYPGNNTGFKPRSQDGNANSRSGASRPEGNRSFAGRNEGGRDGNANSRPGASRPDGNRGGDKFGGPKRADGDRAARRPRNFA